MTDAVSKRGPGRPRKTSVPVLNARDNIQAIKQAAQSRSLTAEERKTLLEDLRDRALLWWHGQIERCEAKGSMAAQINYERAESCLATMAGLQGVSGPGGAPVTITLNFQE